MSTGAACQLVGEEQGRLFVPEIGDDQLPQGTLVPGQPDGFVEHARAAVGPRDVFKPMRRHAETGSRASVGTTSANAAGA